MFGIHKLQQKEPKLARARQYPEWEEYDGEIARFARTLADEGKIKSHTAAADVNALAGAGTGAAVSEASPDEPDNQGSEGHDRPSGEAGTGRDGADVHIKDEL